jgi:hypothetical protein
VDLRTAYEDLNRTALPSDQLSEATRTVLRRAALLEVFDYQPNDAITALRAQAIATGMRWSDLYALAELNYHEGRRTKSKAMLLASALYAYAVLFPAGDADRPSPYSGQFLHAADFYNLALTQGFCRKVRFIAEVGTNKLFIFGGLGLGRRNRKPTLRQNLQFHLPGKVRSLSDHQVVLESSETLDADLVVMGIGVRPSLGLAEQAGIALDRGIAVDRYLQTSVPGIFAAGDVARWPDPHTGQKIRVEHWVVAERQGQTAARNMIGGNEPFDAVPFFWSAHYDTQVLYVGHAETWDAVQIDGSVEARDCRVAFRSAGRTFAVATIGRDLDSLCAELELEAAGPVQ